VTGGHPESQRGAFFRRLTSVLDEKGFSFWIILLEVNSKDPTWLLILENKSEFQILHLQLEK